MDNKIVKSLTTKKRQVNIELLRIIAMLLVLLDYSTWNAKFFYIGMVHTRRCSDGYLSKESFITVLPSQVLSDGIC